MEIRALSEYKAAVFAALHDLILSWQLRKQLRRLLLNRRKYFSKNPPLVVATISWREKAAFHLVSKIATATITRNVPSQKVQGNKSTGSKYGTFNERTERTVHVRSKRPA